MIAIPSQEQMDAIIADLEACLTAAILAHNPSENIQIDAWLKVNDLRAAVFDHQSWLGRSSCGDNADSTVAQIVRGILSSIVSQVKNVIYFVNFGLPMPNLDDDDDDDDQEVGHVNELGFPAHWPPGALHHDEHETDDEDDDDDEEDFEEEHIEV